MDNRIGRRDKVEVKVMSGSESSSELIVEVKESVILEVKGREENKIVEVGESNIESSR